MNFVLKSKDIKVAYRQYLEILQPLIKITSKEADILAEFMYENYLNRDIREDVRNQLTFSTETRKRIRTKLDMSVGSFNNNMATLKRKVLKDSKLPKKLQIYPTKLDNGTPVLKMDFYLAIENAEGSKENN